MIKLYQELALMIEKSPAKSLGFLLELAWSLWLWIDSESKPELMTSRLERTHQYHSVQSLSRVRLFVTPWISARQASLSITNSWSRTKPMSIKSVMPSNHLILCHPLLLPPSICPSIRVFSNQSVFLHHVAKVLEFQLQHQSFKWIFRTDFL